MDTNKWTLILDKIESNFEVIDQGREEDVTEKTVTEFVVFNSPMGTIMLERITKPRVIGEKSFGAGKHTMGKGIEKIYSEDEVTSVFQAYRDVDGEWEKINADGLL